MGASGKVIVAKAMYNVGLQTSVQIDRLGKRHTNRWVEGQMNRPRVRQQ